MSEDRGLGGESKTGRRREDRTLVGPHGEAFDIEEEANQRILAEGLPFIIVDIKERRLAAKEGESFIYTDSEGNIPAGNTSGLGFYRGDTRFLSVYELLVHEKRPVLLTATADRDYMAHFELTNPDLRDEEGEFIARQETLNIRRMRVVCDGFFERIRIKNYNPHKVSFWVEFRLDNDFADIFEVRGLRRTSRGTLAKAKMVEDVLTLAYRGEDGMFRQTWLRFSARPDEVALDSTGARLRYHVRIEPHGRWLLNLVVEPLEGDERPRQRALNDVVFELRQSYQDWDKRCTNFFTDNELFNSVIQRSRNDIRALMTETPRGTILDAGIPWYVTTFGRDSMIAGIEALTLCQYPARESLRMLADLQGKREDPWRDEEPGKVLHELRRGELAAIDAIPHTPYFGSVDSTPLFVSAVAEVFRWSGDRTFLAQMLPHVERALSWVDLYGDINGDGFVEYERRSPKGLINQGWKDSYGAVTHADGRIAEPPIALAEVQGYVYAAKRGAAALFAEMGRGDDAGRLEQEAAALKERFNKEFWMPREDFVAMALDGYGEQVATVTSNGGQCLWTGILDEDKAAAVVARLLMPDMFSGWGIRTLSKGAKSYNPMSYHNGSVWPHDNAIIVKGMCDYGFKDQALVVAGGLFDTAIHHAYYRLPELFCGFTRRGANWPVAYPVACSPQAWAAASIFLVLQGMLGLEPDAATGTLFISRPVLPRWLNHVHVTNLCVGRARLDVLFRREGEVTSFTVKRKEGPLRIVMEE